MTTPTAEELGYEDAKPSGLGYEEQQPSPAALGYGDATPSGIGYEPATPSGSRHEQATPSSFGYEQQESSPMPRRSGRARLRRTGRRSSIGGAPPNAGEHRSPVRVRRSTMDMRQTTTLSTPAHRTLSPRRSSMAGGGVSQFQQKARRRVSFGSSAAINHVEKQYESEQDKKDLWYNNKELNKLKRKVVKMIRTKSQEDYDEDETKDCWRGLETYVKQLQAASSNSLSEEKLCNQIVLQLAAEQEFQAENGETRDSLESQAKELLRQAMQTGMNQAAQDAAEAHAIYMETMDSEQVRACFPPQQAARSA